MSYRTVVLNFDLSLALGAEYDHRIVSGSRVAFYAGIDFLASPDDVQLKPNAQTASQGRPAELVARVLRRKSSEVAADTSRLVNKMIC